MLNIIVGFVFFLNNQELVNKPIQASLPFVQAEMLNSANNLFKRDCVDSWVRNCGQIPVYLVNNDKEELIGKTVCAYWNGDWAVAKMELSKQIPDGYVCRPHSKPVKVEVSDGCYFHIHKAELVRLLIVNPIYASKYPNTKIDILKMP